MFVVNQCYFAYAIGENMLVNASGIYIVGLTQNKYPLLKTDSSPHKHINRKDPYMNFPS